MLRKGLILILLAGTLAALAGAGSALFTSSVTVDANTFTTGTVILGTNPTTALVTFSNMAPGDQVTASMTVSNTGTLALRYAMTTSATDTDSKHLQNQLVLTVKSGVTSCTNGGFSADGTQVYTGPLGSAAIGDPATGIQAGDRTLGASSNEPLCFNVSLPIATTDSYQSATTTATFTFAAEQTAHNP